MNLFALLPDKLIRHRIRHYRPVDGFLTETEAVKLHRLACLMPSGHHALEIGSWKGKSTYCIARGLRGASRLHCIDPFDASGEPSSAKIYRQRQTSRPLCSEFDHNLKDVAQRLVVHSGYSRDFVGSIPPVALALIDGDHSVEGTRFDYEHFSDLVTIGGYLALHDYYPERPELGATWVVENLIRPAGRFREAGCADSLWIGQRSQ